MLSKDRVGEKKLLPHQVAAVEWMLQREADGEWPGGFLCDEMGLGKTITTIALLMNMPLKRSLILAPLAVLHQWSTLLLEAGFCVLELLNHQWVCKGNATRKCQVYLTNYDKLVTESAQFTQTFHRLICDEAHILRNDESKKYLALKTIHCQTKWFLTGTPIVNRLHDFVSLVKLLNPSCGAIGQERALQLMGYLALYRTQDDLKQHLRAFLPPEPEVFNHLIEFTTEAEAKFYRNIQGNLLEEIDELMASDQGNMRGLIVLLLRLRQISVHPQVYINGARRLYGNGYKRPDWGCDSSKMSTLIDILKTETTNCGYVIFCHFQDEMDVIRQRLTAEGFAGNIFSYHGGLSAEQRINTLKACEESVKQGQSLYGLPSKDLLDRFAPHLPKLSDDICKFVIDRFRGGRHTILLAQIQSAGTGLNLQYMNRIVFTTPWWTAALMDQAVGRVLRIGQTQQVHIHYLTLAEESTKSLNIDMYINERVEIKRALCMKLLDAANHTLLPTTTP